MENKGISNKEMDKVISEFKKLFKPQFQDMVEILSRTRRKENQTKQDYKKSLMLIYNTYPSARN